MSRPAPRVYAVFPVAWVVLAALGSAAGTAADGAGSFLPTFVRYGLGGGALVALAALAAYLFDRRRHARARGR